ncbi:LacI family transcriptional regulator [Ktedonobacter sp. SOSP1-85]|nr:LacI family transcriptional regulator [Ktedonobacter sp. SOSP1-85]
MGMQKKLTIQDIARLAGVSKATASRVLNGNPSVNGELRARVMRVVEEHGFVPNATAVSLAGGNTHLIGVLAPPLVWPALPEIIRGVAEYIEDSAYEIVLYSINFANAECNHSEVVKRILNLHLVSGLLAIFTDELMPQITRLAQDGLPIVLIDDQEEPGHIPWVGIDNRESARTAVRYLLELGHTRIAHISGPQHYYWANERYRGYCQALQEAGIAPEPELLLQGGFEPLHGRQCAEQLFARERASWPSAIFVANDQMAYGVLEYAEQQGIRVPEDVTIVGFDDNLLSAYTRPPLTTVHQPFSEMGRRATELLLNMIDPQYLAGPKASQQVQAPTDFQLSEWDQPVHLQLPTSMVIRASSTQASLSVKT